MSNEVIDAAKAEIDTLVSEKFNSKNGTLAQKLRRAGRRLPRGIAQDVAYLEQTQKRIAHPRRRGQLDVKRIENIVQNQKKSLGRIDVAKDKSRERINWLGVLVLNLMMFGLVYYALLKWLGAL